MTNEPLKVEPYSSTEITYGMCRENGLFGVGAAWAEKIGHRWFASAIDDEPRLVRMAQRADAALTRDDALVGRFEAQG